MFFRRLSDDYADNNGKIKRAAFGKNGADGAGARAICRWQGALFSSEPGWNNIRLDRSDALLVHPSENGRVVTIEYEEHGKVVATGTPYENRFASIATIENRKIVHWRDYMDSLAAWTALNKR